MAQVTSVCGRNLDISLKSTTVFYVAARLNNASGVTFSAINSSRQSLERPVSRPPFFRAIS